MKRCLVFSLLIGSCILTSLSSAEAQAQSQQDRWQEWRNARPGFQAHRASAPSGTGSVQYDPGLPVDSLGVANLPRSFIGNYFDTRSGAPLSSGTISRLTWYQGDVGSGPGLGLGTVAVGFFLPGVPSALSGGVVSGVSAYAMNMISLTVSMPAAPFTVAFSFPSNTSQKPPLGPPNPFGSIGMRSATTNSQGFHARQRAWGSASPTPILSQNAILRISGNVVIPVELLEFEVE